MNALIPGGDETPLFFIDKPYRMGCCCCSPKMCAGRNIMDVYIGRSLIGSIQENCKCNCKFSYGVYDEYENLLVLIERCCCFCACSTVPFDILTPDEEDTGKKISKVYSGLFQELFTTNDNFLVEFPDCMKTVQQKLLLVAASMMIEFKHFEQKKNN